MPDNNLEVNKLVAKKVANVFNGDSKVFNYYHHDKSWDIRILSSENTPFSGAVSYCTVGLSDYDMVVDRRVSPIKIEVAGAANSVHQYFPNIIAGVAFYIMQNKWFCFPGAILENGIDGYESGDMKHLYFCPPFLWGDDLRTTVYKNKKVSWLMAIPISESERQFARKSSSEDLEDLFEKKEVDFLNIFRRPVV